MFFDEFLDTHISIKFVSLSINSFPALIDGTRKRFFPSCFVFPYHGVHVSVSCVLFSTALCFLLIQNFTN